MELKVQCDCGQKFKFDVEPVSGRMPFVVTCPVCNADGTAKADALLQQLTPPPRPAGLSIRRSEPEPPGLGPEEAGHENTDAGMEDKSDAGEVRELKLGWKGWAAILAVVALLVGGSVLKSTTRSAVHGALDWAFDKVTGLISGPGHASDADFTGAQNSENVLPNDDGTMLLVKTEDHADVAKSIVEFYATKNQKLVSTVTTNDEVEGVLLVHPAANGYIAIDGPVFWSEPQVADFSAIAEMLSRKYATTAICALMGDDAETGVMALYENGERKFRCERNIYIRNGDLAEEVKLDGETWAKSTGFQPGEEGWEGFTMYDADDLVQQIGFKPAPEAASEGIVLSRQ